MKKAVLVIDMPKACCKCPFFHSDFDIKHGACRANKMELTKDNFYFQKPDECPLKPLPEKKYSIPFPSATPQLYEGMMESENDKGWNACIDEIVGEENETN